MLIREGQLEIVAPAGDEEKARVALLYGADAVYVGSPTFGLRTFFQEMTILKLKRIVEKFHNHGKKVFLTMNSMLHQEDEKKLESFLDDIQGLGIDACIVSEPGLLKKIVKETGIPCHVSTQASVTNAYEVGFWEDLGAKRVVLAREVSLEEASLIKQKNPLPLEMFIHGSMCVSYSGRCVISNYTFGRDANRGGCVQSCRYNYDFYPSHQISAGELPTWSGHFMNATDLIGVRYIRQYIESGIDAVKIEGRRKSPLYVAQVILAYKEMIKSIGNKKKEREENKKGESLLKTIPNRGLGEGFLRESEKKWDAKVNLTGQHEGQEAFAGVVVEVKEGEMYIRTSNHFDPDEHRLYVLDPSGEKYPVSSYGIMDIQGRKQEGFMPSQIIRLPVRREVVKDQVVSRAQKTPVSIKK